MISRLIDSRSVINIALAVMLVVGGFFVTAPTVLANTIQVDPEAEVEEGLVFNTIQEAIDASQSGDVIQIVAGTYNLTAPIVVNKELTITGNTTNPNATVLNAPTSGDDREVFQVLADGVTIQGFTIQGSKDVQKGSSWNSNPGIAVGGDKLMLVNMPDGATEFSFNYWGFAVKDVSILNNVITDNSYGIFLFHSQNVIIDGNIIHSNTRDANTWSGKGIAIYTSKDMADASKVTVGTALPHTNNITINNNVIRDNKLFGIELNHAEAYHGGVGGPFDVDVKITNNEIYNNGGPMDAVGSAFDFARGITSNSNETNVTITGNTIYGHVTTAGVRYQSSAAGIRIPASSGWTIQDNEIYGNTLGIYAYAGATNITINAGTAGPNIIRNNAQGVLVSNGTVAVINENMIYNNNLTTWEISNDISPFGVMNLGATELDANNNWWGSVTPDFASLVSGNVTTAPFYLDSAMQILSNEVAVIEDGAATINEETSQVIITDPAQPVTLTISPETTNPKVNVDSLVSVVGDDKTGTLPEITINSDAANVVISDDTVVTGPANWDGVIQAPTTEAPTGNAPAGFQVGGTVISVGSSDVTLVFSKAVKLVLPGVQGNVAYRPAGSNDWIQITTACVSAVDHSNISSPQECYFTDGNDTVIWTYHFTSFGSLQAISTGGGGGSSAPVITTPEPEGQVLGESTEQKLVLDNGTVYLIENVVRRPFASATDFLSYGYDFANVVMATEEDLSVPVDSFVPAKDGSLILDTTDGITVSVIISGKKRMFATEESFLELGYSFADVVEGDLSWYEVESIVE